jgi:hypothetical protein
MGSGLLVIGLIAVVVGGVLLFFGRRAQAKTNLLQSVATSSVKDLPNLLPDEMVEVKGTIRSDSPLTSEYANKPCVWYSSQVIREYEKRERNSEGNMVTNRTSETISSNKQMTPFFVEDATGKVEVHLEGADIDAPTILDRFEDKNSGSTGPSITIAGVSISTGDDDRTLGYRYIVKALEVDKPIYVLGSVREDGTIGAPTHSDKNRKFIVSYRTEEQLHASWGKQAFWMGTSAVTIVAAGALMVIIGIILLIV